MKCYVTFKITSPRRNKFVVLESMRDLENGRNVAMALFPDDFLMVWNETQWVDYQGQSLDKRFNLTQEI